MGHALLVIPFRIPERLGLYGATTPLVMVARSILAIVNWLLFRV